MLRTRIITALIAIPIVAVVVFLGELWFVLVVAVFALIAGWEFVRMMKVGGYAPNLYVTLGLIVLLVGYGYRSEVNLPLLLSAAILISMAWQLFRHTPAPTADWALTLAGGLYIGWGLGHLVALRQLADGLAWVWLALISTWLADTAAYLVGQAMGRHKLWPRHSPHKTWEGFLAGIMGGVIGAAIVIPFANIGWTAGLVAGAMVPLVALFGDLSISLMKRHVGVKDTSNLFPGHGGFLDRSDSLLFVSVVMYYYAVWNGAVF
ncbi:MAG: phosphatidate cytidylyltransferase [Anaerolineae bacterium]|nr:phosphatidate cytidylyltransferase [Anaerolineae bacterium]